VSEGRVLVAGGNGRLGRAVLAALGPRGRAGVRRSDAATDPVLIDTDGDVDPRLLDGISAIINCAGRVTGTNEALDEANFRYPATLAERARAAGVARFVQVSSFSIFGRTARIGAATPLAPTTAYGASKLKAEQALAARDTVAFQTVALRLPFMFSAEEPQLLGRLVAIMRRTRILPTLRNKPSRRSMITYEGAASALVTLATAPAVPGSTLMAADPAPLELVTVARLIGERLGDRIAVIPTPAALVAAAQWAAPTMIDRLFDSSVLDPAANWLAGANTHRVEDALLHYLDRLAALRPARHQPRI